MLRNPAPVQVMLPGFRGVNDTTQVDLPKLTRLPPSFVLISALVTTMWVAGTWTSRVEHRHELLNACIAQTNKAAASLYVSTPYGVPPQTTKDFQAIHATMIAACERHVHE